MNGNNDFVNMTDVLTDLKLHPEVLEIPIPRYFREQRAKASFLQKW